MPLVLLERSWWAGLNGIYLVIFGFRMWEILIFKWFLPLEIQINSKKPGFWKEKPVEDVVTLGPTPQAALVGDEREGDFTDNFIIQPFYESISFLSKNGLVLTMVKVPNEVCPPYTFNSQVLTWLLGRFQNWVPRAIHSFPTYLP